MKVLFASPEVVPFAKTGGLADVAGALPKAISELGHDIRIFMPRFQKIDIKTFKLKKIIKDCSLPVGGQMVKYDVYEGVLPGSKVKVYFIDQPEYFGTRAELYSIAGKDYPDNLERFTLYCRAVMGTAKQLNWAPDIIHANDWQSALLLAYLKILYLSDPFFKNCAGVYSIHNIGYQGLFAKDSLPIAGLSFEQYTPEKLEYWGQISLTKAGMVYANAINTVSDTYAKEIQTKEYGMGMEGVLQARHTDLYGILNGIDYEVWDPAIDPKITKRYTWNTLALKMDNKVALQKEQNLPVSKSIPLIGMATRLDDQKGFDIFADALDAILKLNCQLVILGTGNPKYHELLTVVQKQYPKNIAINLGFDAALAQQIYAGSDLFLMPSRYEPCGLGQLISFKYGTVPIVRQTGGLADTVFDFDPSTGNGDGFVFSEYTGTALLDAVTRAVAAYKKKAVWKKLVEKIMQYDYSWEASAKKYVQLYKRALGKDN